MFSCSNLVSTQLSFHQGGQYTLQPHCYVKIEAEGCILGLELVVSQILLSEILLMLSTDRFPLTFQSCRFRQLCKAAVDAMAHALGEAGNLYCVKAHFQHYTS